MKKRIFALSLVFLLLLTGCGQSNEAPSTENTAENSPSSAEPVPPVSPEPPPMPEAPVLSEQELAVETLLGQMTLAEKVGQLFFVRCPAEGAVEDVSNYHLGGYLLFARDFKDSSDTYLTREQFTQTIASYQDAASIPLLIGVDEEGGTVARATRNPNLFASKRKSPQCIYAASDEEGIIEDARSVNAALLELGINVNFAPVADVSTDPSDFIYDRTFGQDAEATAEYVAAVVREMESAGIGSVLKHFPGYGNNKDTHTGIAVDDRPYETFTSEDFLPFLSGMEEGADSVLVSHNIVTSMDEDYPASLSPEVHRILREELGFEGVILTDDLAMDAVDLYTRDGSAAVLAILAGNDMVVTSDFTAQIAEVLAAIAEGTIPMELIDSAVFRVLSWKYELGLLEVNHD